MGTFKNQEFTLKDGTTITIRHALESDSQSILSLGKAVIDEDIYQLTTSEEFTISDEDEKKWINNHIENPFYIILIAEKNGQIIGVINFSNGHRKSILHTGEFGLSVAKGFRNQGIGSLLLKCLIHWAESTNFIEKINLHVHATNSDAIRVYQKMGFITEGIQKNELKYSDGTYVDSLMMAKFIKANDE